MGMAMVVCVMYGPKEPSLTIVLPISVLCATAVQTIGPQRKIARMEKRIAALEGQSSD